MFGDESIGSARVNLEGLLNGASRDVWVPLEKVDSGEIRLEIEPIKNDHNNSMQVYMCSPPVLLSLDRLLELLESLRW
jgi:hypothetical protein